MYRALRPAQNAAGNNRFRGRDAVLFLPGMLPQSSLDYKLVASAGRVVTQLHSPYCRYQRDLAGHRAVGNYGVLSSFP